MQALLLKEFYSVKRYLRQYLFVFLFLGTLYLFTDTVMMGIVLYPLMLAMLSTTSLALDEQSGWNQQVLTLPVPRARVLLPKYILSYLGIAAGFLIGGGMLLVAVLTRRTIDWPQVQWTLLIGALLGLFIVALQIPLLIKFGTKNANLLVLATTGGLTLLLLLVLQFSSLVENIENGVISGQLLVLISLVVVFVFQFVSYRISVALYEKKEF